MNPNAVSQPQIRRTMVNDVAPPKPQARSYPQPTATTMTPQLVSSIPLHSPLHQQLGDDDELNQIMHDVGQELKASDKNQVKNRFLFFRRKQKTELHKSMMPKHSSAAGQPAGPAPAQQQLAPIEPVQQAVRNQTALMAAEKTKNPTPVFVFALTLIVSSALIAIAWSTYAQ